MKPSKFLRQDSYESSYDLTLMTRCMPFLWPWFSLLFTTQYPSISYNALDLISPRKYSQIGKCYIPRNSVLIKYFILAYVKSSPHVCFDCLNIDLHSHNCSCLESYIPQNTLRTYHYYFRISKKKNLGSRKL
jgi:hypothetical protein